MAQVEANGVDQDSFAINHGCRFTLSDAASRRRLVSKSCRQLYAEPFKSCEDWSRLELSDRTKLDLVFWVALLAAIHQLNSEKIQNLVPHH